MEIICFFAGIAFVYTKSIYAVILVLCGMILRPRLSFIVWFLVAVFWGLLHEWLVSSQGIPNLSTFQAVLHGQVVSIPVISADKVQFNFSVIHLNGHLASAKILLSCFKNCPTFKAGQIWQLRAKLKKPQNLGNPGSLDYLTWLKARHLNMTGYICPNSTIQIKKSSNVEFSYSFLVDNLLSLRENLADRLAEIMPKGPVLGIVQALSLGVTNYLDKSLWDLFRRTGTTHLMVISGAHIGLVVGISYKLTKLLWSKSGRLCLYYPAAQGASIVAQLIALAYALLAGFAPPAQRALFTCFCILLRNFLSYRVGTWQAWRYSLFVVLVFEPHVVLLPGFYLSFIAVAILILVSLRIPYKGIKKTICLQIACLLGLMPLSLYWFGYGAINGLLANMLAIPLVGFVIVPLALLTVLILVLFKVSSLTLPVKWAVETLLYYLYWVDSFSKINLTYSFSNILYPFGILLGLTLLLVLTMRTTFVPALVLIIAGFFPNYEKLRFGDLQVYVLDVGQGLSVVINTAQHTLVYDTGMKFFHGGDMGKSALIPFLKVLLIKKLDKVIISHPDLDHRGGLTSLEESYPIGELLVNETAAYNRGIYCHSYPPWQWDGVSFRFMPINKIFSDKNNNSCILQIRTRAAKILLTGDIEKPAEDYLVNMYGRQLRGELLIIPHHGSKTSSSSAFIKQVAPLYAVISAGLDNRYKFPHQETLRTLKINKVIIYNTQTSGMVSAFFQDSLKISTYKR